MRIRRSVSVRDRRFRAGSFDDVFETFRSPKTRRANRRRVSASHDGRNTRRFVRGHRYRVKPPRRAIGTGYGPGGASFEWRNARRAFAPRNGRVMFFSPYANGLVRPEKGVRTTRRHAGAGRRRVESTCESLHRRHYHLPLLQRPPRLLSRPRVPLLSLLLQCYTCRGVPPCVRLSSDRLGGGGGEKLPRSRGK